MKKFTKILPLFLAVILIAGSLGYWQYKKTQLVFAATQVITATGSGSWLIPAGVTTVQVELWGGGGGGGLAFSGEGTASGAYVIETGLSVTPGNSITYVIATGGAGATNVGSVAFGSGGAGYQSGGNGEVNGSDAGGGGGGSTSVVVSGTTYIASGGGGGGTVFLPPAVTGSSGGTGGAGSGSAAGGGGGSGTAGSNGSGGTGGAGGTGGTTQTGTNGTDTNKGAGGSSAGASGNGIDVSVNRVGANGSGGALGGVAQGGNGANGTGSDSGGGGGAKDAASGTAGAGGQPAGGAGYAYAGNTNSTGGKGGAGKLIITYTVNSSVAPVFTRVSIPSVTGVPTTKLPVKIVSTNGSGSGQTSLTFTPATPQIGDILILVAGFSVSTSSISSITGDGVTWVKAKSSNVNTDVEIWYGLNSPGTGGAITATFSGPTTQDSWKYGEFSNVAISGNPVDVSGASNATSTTITTASITTNVANDLLIAGHFNSSSTFSSGPTNSFLALQNNLNIDGAAYYPPNAIGSYSTSWTYTGSVPYDTVIAAFLPLTVYPRASIINGRVSIPGN